MADGTSRCAAYAAACGRCREVHPPHRLCNLDTEVILARRRVGQAGTRCPSTSGRINRHDFGVSWNDQLGKGGVVVSDEVFVSLDVEAILAEDLAQA